MRVFTAKLEDLEHYERMGEEALKTELLADKWGGGDITALQFLLQRYGRCMYVCVCVCVFSDYYVYGSGVSCFSRPTTQPSL